MMKKKSIKKLILLIIFCIAFNGFLTSLVNGMETTTSENDPVVSAIDSDGFITGEENVQYTDEPVVEPTDEPVVEPTDEPVVEPTDEPVVEPTDEPVVEPTGEQAVEPTDEPADEPTDELSDEPAEELAESDPAYETGEDSSLYDLSEETAFQEGMSVEEHSGDDQSDVYALEAQNEEEELSEEKSIQQDQPAAPWLETETDKNNSQKETSDDSIFLEKQFDIEFSGDGQQLQDFEEIVECDEYSEEEYITLNQDPDTLLRQYMGLDQQPANRDTETIPLLYSSSYNGDKLTGWNYDLYMYVKEMTRQVAAGETGSTVCDQFKISSDILDLYSWNAQDLGVESLVIVDDEGKRIINPQAKTIATASLRSELINPNCNPSLAVKSVIRDCPYEMFWFGNKITYSYPVGYALRWDSEREENRLYVTSMGITVSLTVSVDYRLEVYDPETGKLIDTRTDPERIGAISHSIDVAAAIVGETSGMSDLEKLTYYATRIRGLSAYNTEAAGWGPELYGDPWQIIYLFDENPDTKVVCEGFAKGFQYLCERTTFNSDVVVYSVAGSMNGTGHLWNMVCVDGENYMLDPTNCTTGAANYNLFMARPVQGSVDQGYVFLRGTREDLYLYNDDSRMIYTDGELSVPLYHEYEEGVCRFCGMQDPDYIFVSGVCGDDLQWEMKNEGTLTVFGTGAMYDYSADDDSERAPWYPYRSAICQVSFEKGITSIGENAFQGCDNIALIEYNGKKSDWEQVVVKNGNECLAEVQIHTSDHGYTAVTDNAVEPSCLNPGWTAGSHCSVCGTVLVAQTEIPAQGHSYTSKITKAATCTAAGVRTYTCSRCKDMYTESIPALGHSLKKIPAKAATTSAEGNIEYYTCTRCGGLFCDAAGKTGITKEEIIIPKLPSGWQNKNGVWYYYDPSTGAMVTGWLKYGDNYYYFNPSTGALATGWVWVQEQKTYFYINPSTGAMTGWLVYQNKIYFYDTARGVFQTGWLLYDNKFYYFNPTTAVMMTGWVWVAEQGTYFYIDPSTGAMTGWLVYQNKMYFYDTVRGVFQTGWLLYNKKYYYFNPSTAVMVTGWLQYNSYWFYLDPSTGAMVTGTQVIDGRVWQFNSYGVCIG